MIRKAISGLILLGLFNASCRHSFPVDGPEIESQVLRSNDLQKAGIDPKFFKAVLSDVNCADSAVAKRKLVLAADYRSGDTSLILVIPYIPNGEALSSAAFSDVKNRFVLLNPAYIREFALKNTLNDTTSFKPVLELMLLHEIGHFILGKQGAFDRVASARSKQTGQVVDDTQPEFLTTIKKVELAADSLAIDIVKRRLKPSSNSCLDAAFDIQTVIPGMQFQISGRRMIDNFGAKDIGFLHDPSNDHPNLELRITFMNYFLYPSDSLRNMIDDYIYNRTVAPVHRQESDPRIYQGKEKILK